MRSPAWWRTRSRPTRSCHRRSTRGWRRRLRRLWRRPPGATEPLKRGEAFASVTIMRAAYASAFDDNPLAGLRVGEQPEPALPAPDWVFVEVRASSLNHHDLWSLRGVG